MNVRAFLLEKAAKLPAGRRNTTASCQRRALDAEMAREAAGATPRSAGQRQTLKPWGCGVVRRLSLLQQMEEKLEN